MTTITEAQRVALVKAADALWDRWSDEAYYIIRDLLDNATIDTNSLWRDCGCDDRIKDGEIHLELVADPCVSVSINPAWIARGTSVLIGDDDESVAVSPEHLPALIAMLTEVQRRIEAGDEK